MGLRHLLYASTPPVICCKLRAPIASHLLLGFIRLKFCWSNKLAAMMFFFSFLFFSLSLSSSLSLSVSVEYEAAITKCEKCSWSFVFTDHYLWCRIGEWNSRSITFSQSRNPPSLEGTKLDYLLVLLSQKVACMFSEPPTFCSYDFGILLCDTWSRQLQIKNHVIYRTLSSG